MAQTISLISGSPFAGCPIVYNVQPNTYGNNRTFHRILLRVYAQLEGDDAETKFDFSQPVEIKENNGSYTTQISQFDISSALQAIAEKYEYTPDPPARYPYIRFRVEAWDEWMVNGEIYSNQNLVKWPENSNVNYEFYAYAFMGAFNDLERMNAQIDGNGVEFLNITNLSRKPNTYPEIVFKNAPFVYAGAFSRGLEIDHMSDDVTPEFVSGAPTYDKEIQSAYRYDNLPGVSTAFAEDGVIVLLVYDDIETDYALKISHVEPTTINPVTGQSSGGGQSWAYQKANLGDAYLLQTDGHIYVATSTGWVDKGPDGPKSVIHTPSAVGSATVGDHSIYTVDRPSNGYELRFVNGMGCLESVCVTSFTKKEANIHTEKYTISRRETLKKFSRMLTVKDNDLEAWKLVSGPLDEAWASWYVHEFLKAQWMWIKVGESWIPCHVIPEETETIIDQEKAQMLNVQFRIELELLY